MKQKIASLLIVTLLVSGCATAPAQKNTKAATPKAANIKEWVMSQNRSKRGVILGAMLGVAAGAALGVATGGKLGAIPRGAVAGGGARPGARLPFGTTPERVFVRPALPGVQKHNQTPP